MLGETFTGAELASEVNDKLSLSNGGVIKEKTQIETEPVDDKDIATKKYVDSAINDFALLKPGGNIMSNISSSQLSGTAQKYFRTLFSPSSGADIYPVGDFTMEGTSAQGFTVGRTGEVRLGGRFVYAIYTQGGRGGHYIKIDQIVAEIYAKTNEEEVLVYKEDVTVPNALKTGSYFESGSCLSSSYFDVSAGNSSVMDFPVYKNKTTKLHFKLRFKGVSLGYDSYYGDRFFYATCYNQGSVSVGISNPWFNLQWGV